MHNNGNKRLLSWVQILIHSLSRHLFFIVYGIAFRNDLIISKVLKINGLSRAFSSTYTTPVAFDWIDLRFTALVDDRN